jgi:hypothetical protein
VQQVELGVPPAPGELKRALGVPVRLAAPAPDDRRVRVGEHRAERHAEGVQRRRVEPGREPLARAHVVVEDPARPAPLALAVGRDAVRVHEVVVAPLLGLRVEPRAERRAGAGERPVEVARVVGVGVGGREVGAAAEPAVRHAVGARQLEVAHVEVHGRHHRAARVRHHAHPGGEEADGRLGVAPLGPAAAEPAAHRGRQRSVHRRPVDAGLLEHAALGEQPRHAAAAAAARPRLLLEAAAAVEGGQQARDLVVHGLGPRRGA